MLKDTAVVVLDSVEIVSMVTAEFKSKYAARSVMIFRQPNYLKTFIAEISIVHLLINKTS